MAVHIFAITVADDQEPLGQNGAKGLEAAFETTEAVSGATYLGPADEHTASIVPLAKG